MTNQSAKEQVKAVLGITPKDEGTKVLKLVDVNEALSQIEEIVLGVIGQENEHYKDMPVPDPDPFALPSDHQNQLRRYQLKRWSDK